MKYLVLTALATAGLAMSRPVLAQVDEDQLGAWYMYFFDARQDDSRWGFQGDAQYRNWDLGGDLEQLLLRGAVTYTPESGDATLSFGYANITSGQFGSNDDTTREDRIYQEASLPHTVGSRLYLRHRFRFEQRWVDDQDFRTRFRYALFANIPLNRQELGKGAVYLALYNEVFINGERDIGDGRSVDTFDRNRLYGGLGYGVSDTLRFQGGYMYQSTETLEKGQLQFSFHQSF